MKASRKSLWLWAVLVIAIWPGTAMLADDGRCLAPLLTDDQAWDRLPPLETGERESLPVWARLLVDSLPRTTAAMLEIDALHRARSPLGTLLAGKIRWTVAQANQCRYSSECALADLRRAGFDDTAAARPTDGTPSQGEERLALRFARRLTLEAGEITDEEMRQLIKTLGEHKAVALVLLVAHANFQDRLLLALSTVADLGKPLPPLAGRFAKVGKDDRIPVPERTLPAADKVLVVGEWVDDPEWDTFDFDELKRNLDRQRVRAGRIRVPEWKDVMATYPEEQRPKQPVGIVWTLVCRGYQPELSAAWSACLRAFAEEAKQDRVFEECVFWIITRTIHCFY